LQCPVSWGIRGHCTFLLQIVSTLGIKFTDLIAILKMYSDLTHHPVNWIDGMRINKSHFEQTNDFVLDHLRDAVSHSLNAYNFGLLHSPDHQQLPSLKWSVQFSAQAFIEIKVETCKAICPDGTRIDITPAHQCHLKASFQNLASSLNLNLSSDHYFYIVIQANPFERKPFGVIPAEEVPPRHPFSTSYYRVTIVPIQQYLPEQGYMAQLPIGKMGYVNGHLMQVPGYIPPCSTIGGSPVLSNALQEIKDILNKIEQHCYKIVSKSYQTGTTQSVVAKNISDYCKKYVELYNQHVLFYQWMADSQAPLLFAEHLGRLWLTMRTQIELMPPREKEEVIAYMAEWMNQSKGDIEQRMVFFKQATYLHNDPGSLFVQMVDTMKYFEELFSRLSQLEFIGKRRGQSLLINEKGSEPEREVKRDNRFGNFSSLME